MPPADPHKPLRDDIRLLGDLLGDTLRTHEGRQLFETVERARALAKNARAGAPNGFEDLSNDLARLDVETAFRLARAFAHFLSLANVAEQHHRIRRRRAYRRDPAAPPQRGSCEEAFRRLLRAGVAPDLLHASVCRLHIELVLTAHPTEISRRTLVEKYNRIAAALDVSDQVDLTPAERDDVRATIQREIDAAWGTVDVRPQRPTPLDEVRSGLVVFDQSLWHAAPRYLREVDRVLQAVTGQRLPLDTAPITFGSWIGGDRDGNPNVTPEVTRRACLLSRWMAASRYLHDIDALRDELSLTAATPELRQRTNGAAEPYRELLREVRARLRATLAWVQTSLDADTDVPPPSGVYIEAHAVTEALDLCRRSLETVGYGRIADGRLTDMLRRVAMFGMTLARLDIRQEAARHTEALDAITTTARLGSYAAWDEPARLDFLVRELDNPRPLTPPSLKPNDDVRDVLETFRTIARIPRGSLGAYVITMASAASDVLVVCLLQKEAGIQDPLRVVPLFETSRDLQNAGTVMDALLSVPAYRDRIGDRQEVMIGYSDSSKDVGRLAAAWDLHMAQEAVVQACRRHDVHVTLFHGRGGSVGRGGGPTYTAIMSQPPGSIDGTLRVTEQGEMLQALFGLPDIALRTMEVYTTATLDAWLLPPPAARQEWRDCMERLAADARAAYRGIVYDNPSFVDYFRTATPEAELGGMNIGSRPARRQKGTTVGGLRAIPWQFAWTQTRLLLGAWLGVEEALERAIARGELARLQEMHREWAHFRSVIDLIEMVLAKADGRIAGEYDRRLVPPPLQPLGAELRARLDRAIAALLTVTGHHELVESNPVLRRSIDVRNPYVDPINLVQVELLCRLRQHPDERARAALLVTINGIAAGMRNTG